MILGVRCFDLKNCLLDWEFRLEMFVRIVNWLAGICYRLANLFEIYLVYLSLTRNQGKDTI